MIYRKEKLNVLREIETSLKQYANKPAPIYLDEIVRHFEFNYWLKYKDVEVSQLFEKYNVPIVKVRERSRGGFKLMANWNKINKIVLAYQKNPSRQRKAYLKKRFLALVGKLYVSRLKGLVKYLTKIPLTDEDTNKFGKSLAPIKNMPYRLRFPKRLKAKLRQKYYVDVYAINYSVILWEWISCRADTRNKIYGKNLINSYNPQKNKSFKNYFYNVFNKDKWNLANWCLIKTFGMEFAHKEGKITLESGHKKDNLDIEIDKRSIS